MGLLSHASLLAIAFTATATISCTVAPLDTPDEGDALGAQAAAWDAESATEEARSTHLWIVDHALATLAGREDARGVLAWLQDPICRASWQQGLVDADFRAAYNDGRSDTAPGSSTAATVASGATWASHFYDPDTETNYKGQRSPTGRTRAAELRTAALEAFARGARADGCYALGLSLHYATDVTQPMHAANFTAKNRPLLLHSNVETLAVAIQDAYALAERYDGPTYASPDEAFVAAARDSKARWKGLLESIYAAYRSNGALCRAAYATWTLDRSSCWRDDAGVKAQVGDALEAAQRATAAYILAVGAELPTF
jgi:phospholipase C